MVDQIRTPKEETSSSTHTQYSEKSQFRHESAAIHAANLTLSQLLDLDRVLELALETTLRAMDGQAGCLHIPSESESNQLELRVHTGLPSELAECIQAIPQDAPEIQRIITSDEVVVSEQSEKPLILLAGDASDTHLSRPGVWAYFPMLARGRLQGLMSILVEELTPERAQLLRTISQHAAIALDNARLYRRAHQDAQRLSREAERWHTLNQVAIAVSGARSEQDVYDTITHTLSNLGFSAAILIPDSDKQTLTVVSSATSSPRLVRAIERLTGLSLVRFQFPFDQFDFYRRAIEQGKSEFIQLGERHFAQLLPEPFTHLASSIVRRVSLDCGIAVPLKINGQPVAVLIVAGDDLIREDVPVIAVFADQASVALENARLIEAERRQHEVAETLRDLVVTVNSTLDVDQVLDITVHRLQALYQATACSVSFLEEDGKTFAFRATTDPGIDVSQHVTFPADKSIAGRAIRERKVQVVDNVDLSPDYRAEIARRTGIISRSLLTTPLFIDDQPLGVIQIVSASPNAFTQADAELLATTARLIETAIARAQTYAKQATTAIENTQLFEAEQRQRQMAEALHRAALTLTSTMALDQVFERILTELHHVVPYDSASVQLLKGDQLEIIGGRGFPNLPELLGISFPVRGNNPNALVLESREPVIIADVQPHYRAFKQEPHAAANIHGWLGVPLLMGDRVIGMLALDKQEPDFYNEAHAQTARAYAAQAAIAIENARLHQRLQEYAAKLESRVEARTAEVNREHERLLAVLENAGEAIAIADAEGVIEYANPAWEKLTGYDATQVIQRKTRILDEEVLPDLFFTVRNAAQTQRIWCRQLIGQRPDGATYIVDLTVTPVFDDSKALVNLVAIYRDVTQYKELDRVKSEFLNTAAHNLRSPLTSILGYSELLLFRDDLSKEERARFLQYINDHAIHLKELVNDLLDISRIELGTGFAVKSEPLDLYPLLEQEIRSWRQAYPDHTYELLGDRGSPQVEADTDRVRQVMRNLLSNATKYSPQGSSIIVSATPVGGFMEVTVTDEGIGMSREELDHVFEKFWRADASPTAVDGTGLGLIIVKHIIEQHGGHIWVESAKGKGTSVHFTLPMVDRQTTVLIAEDEASVREVEHRVLTNNGIATLLSSSGQEAIEMAQAHRPDLILLDLMMPGLSGQEVLHILKFNPATQHIPVLVVSARSGWQTIEESYSLGAVDFLTKPFEYHELLSRVRRALKTAAINRQQATGHLPLPNT